MLLIIIWYFFIIVFGPCLGLNLQKLASASASKFWHRLTSLTGIQNASITKIAVVLQ